MESNFSLKEFLDSQTRTSTKKSYRVNIDRFVKWYGASAEEILKQRQDDWTKRPDENHIDFLNRKSNFEKILVKYHGELIANGISINSARTYTVGIIQLFNYYDMPVVLKNSQKRISETVMTTRTFPMVIDHVKEMFIHASEKERVILSLATDLGIRIGDFIKLEIKDVPELNQEPPIPFVIMTRKKNVVSQGFISGETVELLKAYIPTLDKSKNSFLFPNNNGGHISDVWLNELIQRLATKSGIELNGKTLSFHCFRKMFISAGIDSGVGLSVAKILCGKSIPQSDETYFTVVRYKPLFLKIKEYLTIQSTNNKSSESIESLKNTIFNLEKTMTEKLRDQQNIIEAHKEQLEKVQSILDQVKPTDQQFSDFKRFNDMIKNADAETYSKIRAKTKDELLKYGEKIAESTGLSPFEAIIEGYLTNNLDKLREHK